MVQKAIWDLDPISRFWPSLTSSLGRLPFGLVDLLAGSQACQMVSKHLQGLHSLSSEWISTWSTHFGITNQKGLGLQGGNTTVWVEILVASYADYAIVPSYFSASISSSVKWDNGINLSELQWWLCGIRHKRHTVKNTASSQYICYYFNSLFCSF